MRHAFARPQRSRSTRLEEPSRSGRHTSAGVFSGHERGFSDPLRFLPRAGLTRSYKSRWQERSQTSLACGLSTSPFGWRSRISAVTNIGRAAQTSPATRRLEEPIFLRGIRCLRITRKREWSLRFAKYSRGVRGAKYFASALLNRRPNHQILFAWATRLRDTEG